MTTPRDLPGSLISTILRHDAKVTSYKIALVRAINDAVLAFPDMPVAQQDIAIPLRILAASWIAYYWPFANSRQPIRQGPQATRPHGRRQDVSFRPALAALRCAWETITGVSAQASDGAMLVAELRVPRTAAQYPPSLHTAYAAAERAVVDAMAQPITYAGPRGTQ